MVGDTILIKDISINGNNNLTNADQLSKTLTGNTINELGIDASSRTIWVNGQPYGNAFVNINDDNTVTAPIGAEIFNDFVNNIASGEYSHAEGKVTEATALCAHSEGYKTKAKGISAHAEGQATKASGDTAHAEGQTTEASDDAAHAEGNLSKATSVAAHAEGEETEASARSAHAEGNLSKATNIAAHAEGEETEASARSAHAEGKGTVASNEAEHAEGKYNKSNTNTNTIHSVGIGTSDIDRKNAEEIHYNTGDKYVIGIGGYDGTNSETDGIKTVQKVVNESINQITISYLKLKELRDASQLVPGQEYRIIDYKCTINPNDKHIKAAKHWFDIIVTADDESTLSEVARAVKREGDTHFDNSDLNAWKIWYCLDNDTTRFAWADETETNGNPNGRGVIYHMIDEFGNDCPYDFKNIQFYRKWDSSTSLWSTISSVDEPESKPCYTFSSSHDSTITAETAEFIDCSLFKINGYSTVYSNVIKECIEYDNDLKKQILNNNCFFGTICYLNSFGNSCQYITFGDNCYSNSFRNNCSFNSFGNGCQNNIFRNSCSGNSFGNSCSSNSFGDVCLDNNFGENCTYNSLGNSCQSITFGDSCYYNSFGNNCSDIKFALDSSASTKYNHYQHNHFGDGCRCILFTGEGEENDSNQVQNYTFAQGLKGSENSYLTIDGDRGREYDTYISKDAHGVVKKSVIADKLDKMINISYEELYNLRRDGKLIPGQQYRITDYECTTSVYNTNIKAAGHQFDIIVMADSKNKLNEEARAIQHMDNDYFKDCNLSAWKIWYSLDNDTERFDWADEKHLAFNITSGNIIYPGCKYIGKTTIDETEYMLWLRKDKATGVNVYYGTTTDKEGGDCYAVTVDADGTWNVGQIVGTIPYNANTDGGKGVIYRMIDEFGNDCPYDFKNIQFYREWNADKSLWSNIPPNNKGVPCYTFSSVTSDDITDSTSEFIDSSLTKNDNSNKGIHSNVIKAYISSNKQTLNNICLFGNACNFNSIENDCYNNTFGKMCCRNSFGNNCYSNSFGTNCSNNVFGNSYQHNTFGNNCTFNSFGNGCSSNSFGDGCSSNSFGNECSSNSLWDSCKYNSFGNACQDNALGQTCIGNSFGNDCKNIKFSDSASAISRYDRYLNNHFGDGCQYILFENAGWRVSSSSVADSYVQNYNVDQGLTGSTNKYVIIDGFLNEHYVRVKHPDAAEQTIKI